MRKLGNNRWHDNVNVHFELGDEDLDRYEINVDAWYIIEPKTKDYPGIEYVDEVYINTINKNGIDLDFTKQKDIPEEIKQAVIEELEFNL